jgi:hypothetical protein
MKTLYARSIRPANMDLTDQPLASGVLALRPDLQDFEEACFSTRVLKGNSL